MRNTFDEVDDNYWLLQYMYNEIANEHLKKTLEVNSLRKGKLIEMKTTISEFGRQSL